MSLAQILPTIVASPELHAKWLNTLSMMENTGARKISACEHPTLVNEIILKHAAEEARHAYYLKKQVSKINAGVCPTYEFSYLLAPVNSYQYLHKLDMAACRYVKDRFQLSGYNLRFAAYLFVTYAIEVRADELYAIYQGILTATKSRVNVKSIILEEEGHLEEMQKQLEAFSPDWQMHAQAVVAIEQGLYQEWIDGVSAVAGL
jgi:bacterioferritin (cytochrome b1)